MDNIGDVLSWLEVAQRDYDIALHLSEVFRPLPVENICYNCQQAIEKTLKAILIFHVGEYPKTHDIRELHQLCKELGTDFGLTPGLTRTITRYATKSRYPDEMHEFTGEDTELGLRYAKQVLVRAREEVTKCQPHT